MRNGVLVNDVFRFVQECIEIEPRGSVIGQLQPVVKQVISAVWPLDILKLTSIQYKVPIDHLAQAVKPEDFRNYDYILGSDNQASNSCLPMAPKKLP